MRFRDDWKCIFVEGDTFKSTHSKGDLIYLINKFTVGVDGKEIKKSRLAKMSLLNLMSMWRRVKPFEFGRWPIT